MTACLSLFSNLLITLSSNLFSAADLFPLWGRQRPLLLLVFSLHLLPARWMRAARPIRLLCCFSWLQSAAVQSEISEVVVCSSSSMRKACSLGHTATARDQEAVQSGYFEVSFSLGDERFLWFQVEFCFYAAWAEFRVQYQAAQLLEENREKQKLILLFHCFYFTVFWIKHVYFRWL